jgi:hypothetical protein
MPIEIRGFDTSAQQLYEVAGPRVTLPACVTPG